MTADIKPYPVYKDPGVPWLGQVPEHWNVRRIKSMFHEKDERRCDGTGALLSLTRTRGIIPHSEATDRLAGAENLSKYKVCGVGDLVMNRMQAWSGMFALSSLEGVVSPDYSVFRAVGSCDAKYFELLFRTPPGVAQFARLSKGIGSGFNRLYTEDFGGVLVAVPPTDEQSSIVRYLDHADRKVRHAIRARQQLIKLLTEQKQAIIQRAVTRGLNPDVRLKPSGVPWLGDVPDHWEVLPLKRVSRVQGGYAFSSSLFDDHGVPIVRMTNLKSGRLKLAGATCVPESECIDRFSARAGDLLYGLSGSIGNFGVVRDEDLPVQINQRVGRFVPLLSRISGSYLALVVQTPEFSRQVLDMCTGTAQLNVSPLDVERVVITVPSLPEQTAILGYAHDATAILDNAIDAARREIDLLREYRTRLIADVVTGKLDVRDVPVPDDETDVPPEELESIDDVEAIDQTDDVAEGDSDSSSEESA